MIASGRRLLQPEALNPAASGEGRRNRVYGPLGSITSSVVGGAGPPSPALWENGPAAGQQTAGAPGSDLEPRAGEAEATARPETPEEEAGFTGRFLQPPGGDGELPASFLHQPGRTRTEELEEEAGGRKGRQSLSWPPPAQQ